MEVMKLLGKYLPSMNDFILSLRILLRFSKSCLILPTSLILWLFDAALSPRFHSILSLSWLYWFVGQLLFRSMLVIDWNEQTLTGSGTNCKISNGGSSLTPQGNQTSVASTRNAASLNCINPVPACADNGSGGDVDCSAANRQSPFRTPPSLSYCHEKVITFCSYIISAISFSLVIVSIVHSFFRPFLILYTDCALCSLLTMQTTMEHWNKSV